MKIKLSPFFILILVVSWIFGYIYEFLMLYFYLMLHELCHAFVSLAYKKRIICLDIKPTGLKITTDMEFGGDNRLQGFLIYFSGPAASLSLAVLALLKPGSVDFYINMYLGIFNLLPIIPLDGSSIIFTLLKKNKGTINAMRITSVVSVFTVSSLAVIFTILMMYSKNIYYLIYPGVLIIIMLIEMKYKRIEVGILNIDGLLKRKNRIRKKGNYPVKQIAVMGRLTLYEILSLLDHDCFHVVNVLDENLDITGSINENELLEAISKYGGKVRIIDTFNT